MNMVYLVSTLVSCSWATFCIGCSVITFGISAYITSPNHRPNIPGSVRPLRYIVLHSIIPLSQGG